MAEVLGVLASGIAVAQLADQIVRSICNIYDFWKTISDAPKDLNDALEELKILGETLIELQQDLSNHNGHELTGTAAKNCLQYCRRVAEDLEAIVTGLQRNLDGKKGRRQWAAIKAAFHRRSLRDFQQRLDRAKSMLTLAISCYSLSIHRNSISLRLNGAPTLKPEEHPSHSIGNENRQNLVSGITATHSKRLKTFNSVRKLPYLGLYRYQSTTTLARWRSTVTNTDKANDDHDIVTEHKFIPAPWLRLNILSFQSAKSCGIWKYSFRPIRVVPLDCPLFEACRTGTVDDMISILSQGTASLHDVYEDGKNALYISLIAVICSQFEICKWVIEQGVDCNAADRYLKSPLFGVQTFFFETGKDLETNLNIARLLIEQGQIDPMVPINHGRTILDLFYGYPLTLKYLIRSQEKFFIDLSQTDSYGRTALQNQSMRSLQETPMILRILLGDGPIPYEKATEVWIGCDGPETLLLGSARRLSSNSQCYGSLVLDLAFVSDLIQAGADLHVQDGSGATPLDHLLSARVPFWHLEGPESNNESNKEPLLFDWLSCLCRSGVDLREYLHKEEKLHENGNLVPKALYRRHIDRIFTVYYGARHDDVTVLVEDVYQDKNPLYHIPGSWDWEAEYAERRGLKLIEGESPSAFWSVTTAGFQYGDHSPERASCDARTDVRKSWYD